MESPIKKSVSASKAIAIVSSTLLIVCAVFTLLLVKNSADLQKQIVQKNEELSVQSAKLSAMQIEKSRLEGSARDQETRKNLLADFSTNIASDLDSMDKVLLKTDSNSLALIDWYTNNCTFNVANGDLAVASQKYQYWKDVQNQTNVDYSQVKSTIQKHIDDFTGVADLYNSLQNSNTRSGASVQ